MRTLAIVYPDWMQHYGHQGEVHAFTQFENIVRRLAEVSPLLEVESIGTIIMSARGPTRYFGGEDALLQKVFSLAHHSQVACGVAIAPSRFAAVVAAHISVRQQRTCNVHPSQGQQFIDALPVQSLQHIATVSSETISLLQRLGLATCGAVRAIGEAALIDRFGTEGLVMWQLVTGEDVRHIAPHLPPADFACSLDLETPITHVSHLVAASHDVVNRMQNNISAHGMQCVRLFIECETDHAETSTRVWGEPRGFTAAAIAQRMTYQLDGWLVGNDADAPTGGIVRVQWIPVECRESLVVQPVLWGGNEENTERAARAVAMATAIDDSVVATVPQWEGGRDIAHVYSHIPVSMVDLSDAHAANQRVMVGRGVPRDWSGALARPSPASVFPQPLPAIVRDSAGHLVRVSGRHQFSAEPAVVEVGGYCYRVQQYAGPWPVEERWWDTRRRRRHVRTQMLVCTKSNATRVLLLSLENSEWSVVARYD